LAARQRQTTTDDADTGPNNLQNFPVLSSVTQVGTTLSVQYSVPSTTANSAYPLRVEFFATDSDGQEGQTLLGFDTYMAADAGTTKTASITLAASLGIGSKLVATATDTSSNTSEFSASAIVQPASCSTFVTNTNNSGAGSLRQAITCANSDGFDDIIVVPAGQYNLSGSANDVSNLSGDLDITEVNHSITIRGAGQDQTMINGGGVDRVILILKGTAVLESLSITGGSAPSGGGILNAGNLTLNDVTVSNNTAVEGGGISNSGQITLNRTIVQNNTATSTSSSVTGGGIYGITGGSPTPSITIVDSTIESNGVSVSTTSSPSPVARGGGIASFIPVRDISKSCG
jgi:hypothetical protein